MRIAGFDRSASAQHLTLPAMAAPSTMAASPAIAAPPTTAVPPPQPLPAAGARNIAVCDDDIRFIRYVERLLGEVRARVSPVTTLDPEEAVRVVVGAGCDAALIDLHIYNDGHAGLTLVRLFREHPATAAMPLLLVTGAAPRDLKPHESFLREHHCGVLPKPFGTDALLTALGLARMSCTPA
jgi:CheY-like chemotaxis protein